MTKARDLANAGTALTTVSATELGYLDGVTSAVQTQIDAKLASSTAATTYVANSLADAKGDLFVASADNTVTRLPVGSTGETIVADSSTTTGLRYTSNFAAGKNKIINGDFGIWQRGTSFTTNYQYTADRWIPYFSGTSATQTVSQQVLTPASITGYESQYFMRNVVVGGSDTANGQNTIIQYIEDVRTFAGQTVTFSVWAKAATGTPKLGFNLQQLFGTGGSTTVVLTGQSATISTSWVKYSFTFSMPSISGKTIGANSSVAVVLYFSAGTVNATSAGFSALQSNTFDIWGMQLEAGSVATAFQTATGTIQGELAACQRYYFRFTADNNGTLINASYASTSVYAAGQLQFPVPMRTVPTSLDTNTLKWSNYAGTTYNMTSVAFNQASAFACQVYGTVSGVTAGQVGPILGQGTNSYVGLSAEL